MRGFPRVVRARGCSDLAADPEVTTMKRLLQLTAVVFAAVASSMSRASHTPAPASVTVAGSLQSELGCPGDWQPACAATHLAYDPEDDVWQGSFHVPAGSWEYKVALNDAWDENYGAGAVQNGPNIGLSLATPTDVKFYYDHKTHWGTDNVQSVIATVAGSFQSELGCATDWDPSCLRSWLEDPDRDGIYALQVRLPAGSYEAKVAIGESWDENYGAGGVPNGANIGFTVQDETVPVAFRYDAQSHVLAIEGATVAPPPYQFTGFFPPVSDPPTVNVVKAGKIVALRFSLGGDHGLDVFQVPPTSAQTACPSPAVENPVDDKGGGGPGLTYDASLDQYVFRWKTDRSWAGTCREFRMSLDDGSLHTALFKFTR